MNRALHFSSATDDWATPPDLFDLLDAEFGFTLDAAASAGNAKCDRFFSIADDGLAQDWGTNVCWLNPPYGSGVIDRWIDKTIAAVARGATVVALVPDRPGSRWHDACMAYAEEKREIEGRLKFSGAANAAPFPSCVFVFRPGPHLTWAATGSATFVLRRQRRGGPRWRTLQLRPTRGGTP